MSIEEYIAKLKIFEKDLPKKVDEIIMANKSFITSMIKLRLYNYGTDGNDKLIGRYSRNTIPIKIANNQKTSFITLRDQGNFYKGMFLYSKQGEYSVDSTDRKTDMLYEIYGRAITEFTNKQQNDIVVNIIDPDLQKYLDELGGEISIDL